jgi:predicted nucleic acid-binding protein
VNINKKINDYEDRLQYYAALNAKCDMIITENIGDFFFSEIPVYTPKDYILNVL